jgi:signal transduction histidine kinase
MLEATDGALWSASLSGGVGRVRNGRYSPIALSGANAPSVSSFAEDGRGHVWISLDRSPTVFAMRGDSVVRRLDDAAGIRDTVLLLVAERGDTLWGVGTRSLVRIAGDRAVTIESAAIPRLRGSLLRRTAGVPSLGAFLAHGRLWIAGEGGIGHFSVAQLHAAADTRGAPPQPTLLDAHDGIPVPTVRSLTLDPVSASPDGRFFIRTATGLAVLDPRRMIADARPPRPIIEEVTVGGRAMPLDRAIEIGPNPERVEVRVTATSAAFPERVRLEHRLDGAETAWVPTGASRTVTYTQLRPGTYTFHVRSPNASTGGDPAEATLSFRVMPAWYQAWWFAGLAILIVAAGGPAAVFVYLRHRGRLREAQMQARFDAALAERTRVARELHDTLLQGFTGITLQLQGVLRTIERSPDTAAAERLAQTLSVADATLLDARRMIWDMRAPELEHNDLSAALERAAMQAVADTPITVRFQVKGRTRRLAPLVESTALRVGREATTNAVRHAAASTIDIDLVYADAHLELTVRDDGRGFDGATASAAALPGHWGVSGMRERSAGVGGTLDIRGAPGVGTVVSLRLPTNLEPVTLHQHNNA